jgi:cadmium resistance protein CadD (predicted permease)
MFVNTLGLNERGWLVASILLMLGAAVALVTRHVDAAFVLAALGAVSWFLGLRTKLKATIPDSEPEPEDEDKEHED